MQIYLQKYMTFSFKLWAKLFSFSINIVKSVFICVWLQHLYCPNVGEVLFLGLLQPAKNKIAKCFWVREYVYWVECTYTHSGRSVCLIHSIWTLFRPQLAPGLWSHRAYELWRLPHTASGLDTLLTNNAAANGPERTRTHTLTHFTWHSTVRLHLHLFPLEEVPILL